MSAKLSNVWKGPLKQAKSHGRQLWPMALKVSQLQPVTV